jgi:hypothetical protein
VDGRRNREEINRKRGKEKGRKRQREGRRNREEIKTERKKK